MSDPTTAAPAVAPDRRKPALLAVTAAALLAAAGYGTWWALTQRHFEHTDNAYVHAPLVQVTAQQGGTVLAVLVDDTDTVAAGAPLVKLDPADARLALERAESTLARTVREVRTMYATNAAHEATVRLREAEVARVQTDLARAADDLRRRLPLRASGAVSGEELQHAEAAVAAARSALAGAESALAAAREQAASHRALTDGTPVERHPGVEQAAAAVREAWLALQRTELTAPVAGQVARRNVQPGQRIAAGTALMTLVPLEQLWVEANFKEPQLRRMRVGQPATLHADVYGQRFAFRGRVAGFGAGTGAAFALLPAQNATGNWVKVVQRLPVRIELDRAALAERPLRVGLSMEVEVDVADGSGAPLAATAAVRPGPRAALPETTTAEADALVRRIIAAHLGPAPASPRRGAAPLATVSPREGAVSAPMR